MKIRVPLLTLALAALPAATAHASDVSDAVAAARAPEAQLERTQTITSFGAKFVRFRQEAGGVPVLGAEAVVTDAPGSRDLLVDGTRHGVRAPGDAQVGRAAAIATARRAAEVRRLRAPARASLAILPGAAGQRLVWRVVLSGQEPLGSFEVLVDARTGEVVRVRDMIRRLTGSARLFDPNPIETRVSSAGLSDSNDATSPALEAQQFPRTLQRLNDNCLNGKWVRAYRGNTKVDVCDNAAPVRDWSGVTRSSVEFEPLMAYFHLDRTQAFIQGLGFANVLNRPIEVFANADVSTPEDPIGDNSFYDPATGYIALGIGGTDDGEDADVIVHEYGHAIQDDQVPGFGTTSRGPRWVRALATTLLRPSRARCRRRMRIPASPSGTPSASCPLGSAFATRTTASGSRTVGRVPPATPRSTASARSGPAPSGSSATRSAAPPWTRSSSSRTSA